MTNYTTLGDRVNTLEVIERELPTCLSKTLSLNFT